MNLIIPAPAEKLTIRLGGDKNAPGVEFVVRAIPWGDAMINLETAVGRSVVCVHREALIYSVLRIKGATPTPLNCSD